MARFVLAWEHGGGLGHAMSLAQVARVLLARGHDVTLVWRNPGAAHHVLGPLLHHPRLRLRAAPTWPGQVIKPPLPHPVSTYADLLCLVGYLDPSSLTAHTSSWLDLLRTLQADVLVTDHAPGALLAAKAWPDLRTAQIGNGYFQPPRRTPLPSFRFWDATQVDAAHEATVLAHCQAAQKACGITPLTRLSDLLNTHLDALLTWPELSTYDPGLLTENHLFIGPLPSTATALAPQWPPSPSAQRCLAYLKAGHPDTPTTHAILRLLIDAGIPTLLVLSGGTDAEAALLAPHPHVRLVNQLVDMNLALQQADVVVCQGSSGTVLASLSAGRPLLMLPGHVEQWINSYRVCDLHAGIALQAAEIAEHGVAALRALFHDDHFRTHARQVAARHPPSESHANLARLGDQLEALLTWAPARSLPPHDPQSRWGRIAAAEIASNAAPDAQSGWTPP